MIADLKPLLAENAEFVVNDKYVEFKIENQTDAVRNNAFYFDNTEWAEEYLTYCHRNGYFRSRWNQALGDVREKIIIDIGCGPGNVFATLAERPKLLIGIDIAPASLISASQFGYLPVLADANQLPFKSQIADIITLNATLHHCENMSDVLKEAARLVKPGGLIVTDHDPQLSAWDYKGLAKVMWNFRLIMYKIIGHGFHKSSEQQKAALASEIHHKPGHGVTESFFRETLEPLGFSVHIFPHNHEIGEEVFSGEIGNVSMKYKVGNLLSGRNPMSKSSALSIMCLAYKN